MSTVMIGMLLPGQRALLAKLYRDIAAVYRSGFKLSQLEETALVAEMIATHFEFEINCPMTTDITRSPLCPPADQTASTTQSP